MRALTRYLRTDGLFGEVPDWYPLLKAARYLGVPPWDLATRPAWWQEVALAAQDAEAKARASRQSAKGG